MNCLIGCFGNVRYFFFADLNTSHIVCNKRVNPFFPIFVSSPFLVRQERFAEIFGQDAAAEIRRSQESFKKWLLAGMTLMTGVVVGSFIAQRRL